MFGPGVTWKPMWGLVFMYEGTKGIFYESELQTSDSKSDHTEKEAKQLWIVYFALHKS